MEDDEIIEVAARLGFLTETRHRECRKLVREGGVTALEALARAGRLSRAQVRGVLIVANYERARREDVTLGERIVQAGLLAVEAVEACLSEQEGPHGKGEPFPRLRDMLQRRGLLDSAQFDALRQAPPPPPNPKRSPPANSGRQGPPSPSAEERDPVERLRRASPLPPRRAEPPPPAPPPPCRPVPMFLLTDEAYRKHAKAAGRLTEGFSVALRRTKIKDPKRGELPVVILDLAGRLDDDAAKRLDEFLEQLIDDGATHLAINGEKLDALSPDGIGVLAQAAKRCRDARGDLRLCSLPDDLRRVMSLTAVGAPLQIYDGERGAVMSFKYV